MFLLSGQNILETSASDTKILVILEISDLKIDRVLSSKDKNSLSKKEIQEIKS